MNTHRALLECCWPPSTTLIAAGPEKHCRAELERWLAKHPLPQWTSAYVVQVVAETQCEPGVGIYTVPLSTEDEGDRSTDDPALTFGLTEL